MSTTWKTVRLGEVLGLVDTSVPSNQLGEVNLAGVYSFGRGLFKRGPMFPDKTSYKTYNRLVPDDFVISQPKAWEGAIARVTTEFEDWYLSPVFPTFRVNRLRLEPTFLEWLCKRKGVWAELHLRSRGIGARRETVSPEQFLSIEIILPPLPEQRRMVARIEELAAKISEARSLRHKVIEETEKMISSTRFRIFEGARRYGERDFDSLINQLRGTSGIPLKEYKEDGKFPVIDQGKRFIAGYCDDTSKVLNLPGPVVVWGDHTTNVKLIDFDFVPGADGTKVFLPKDDISVPFLYHFLKSVEFPDFGYSRYYRHLKKVAVPTPPHPEQTRIVSKLDALDAKVDKLKHLQTETAAELDALLPSILDRAFKGEI